MTTWQAILSTATQSRQDLNQLTGMSHAGFGDREPKPRATFVSILGPLVGHISAAWKWLERKRTQQLTSRRLRVAETISLGEKRFVSILQVDGAQFLIGGSTGNISLLAILKQEQAAEANNTIASVEAGS